METIKTLLRPTAKSTAGAQRQVVLNLVLHSLGLPGFLFTVTMAILVMLGIAPAITVVVGLTMQLCYLVAYELGRRTYVTLAGWIVVGTLIATMTLTALKTGLGHITNLGLAIAVLTAGALNGLWAAFGSALVGGALYALVGYAQLQGRIANPIPPTATIVPEALGFVLAAATLALLAHFTAQELHRASQLQAAWAQYQMTFDAMEDVIFVTDPAQRVVLGNAAARAWLERAELDPDIVGKPVTRAFPFLSPGTMDAYHRAQAEQRAQVAEAHAALEEQTYTLDVRHIPTMEANDVYVITVIRDITARKDAETALRESEEKLRHIVENSTNLFYAHTPDHQLTYLSPQTRSLLDYEPEEAMTHWTELTTDNPINQRGLDLTDRAIDTGEAQPPYELELVGKEGRKIWVEVREAPVVENGETVAIVGSLTDVTERKQVAQALRESESRARALLQALPDMMFRINRAGVYLDYKAARAELYAQEHVIIGERIDDTLPPDLATLSYTNIERALATNEIQVFEYRLPVPDQGPRDYEARMVPSGPDEVITIVRDVTERKRMEQALREREALLKATGAMAKVGGWELDAETLEVRWTEQTYHIHGVPTSYKPPLDEAIEFFHPDDRDRLSAAIQRALQAGAPYDLELRFISHQGEHRWVRTQCRPEIAGGTTRKLRGTIQDITERKEAEIALRQTSERLRIQHEIDTAILAAQSPQEIMRVTLERLHHLIPCSHASVAELHATQDLSREVIAFADDQIHSHPPDWHPIADIGLDLMAQIRQGRPYVVQDIAELATLTPLEQALQARGLRAYVSVPLPGQETPIGSLNLGSALPHYFQPDHIEILEEVAASLSVALQQAHLLEQAQQDAETKATLLREVNHRVKNNLSTIVNLLYLEHHHVSPEAMAAYEPIMQDLMHRIVSLARVHDMLSAAEWKPLPLGNLAQQIITGVIQAAPQAIDLTLTTAETPVWVTPDQAHHLALILNELATNTLKYAADGRTTLEIGLEIARTGDRITLTYRNDGPDYPEEVIRMERHSAGLDIIQQVVHRNLNGTVSLRNDGGAVAEVVFPQQDKSQDGVKPYNR